MTPLTREQKSAIYGWLAFVFSALTIILQEFFRIDTYAFVKPAAVILLLMSVPLVFLSFSALKTYGDTPEGASYFNTTTVADKGIYSIVRHPQYSGYILLTTGFALLSCHPVVITTGALAILLHILQTVAEEAHCREKLGEEYEQYTKSVPRFNIIAGIYRKFIHRD